ncbi:DEAD/DEAH box helicase [Rhizobium ruizarguesonis]|uniref:DEAD/DEAH box helicase n=1 Tax=Rhizobium ruizarguesonis TaxID=2081791 RepID=UPI001A8BF982|nr:DEAD/DEAH box helicase [Rhizobium ruizarguesonis]
MIRVRSTNWKVQSVNRRSDGCVVVCRAINGIAKGKTSHFLLELEKDFATLDPADVELIQDESAGFIDTKLFLEASFRHTPTTSREPLTLGKAAIDDLSFQHVPVRAALNQDRVRLLIADDVGLGKTLEAGLIASELILRGRAKRILVVTTRSMLKQFQKEFWTRFSIPLSRLDSAAIRRMRNQIPAHYNVFDQFDRAIVSIDTLKRDSQIRAALEQSTWELVIIDEAHSAARRAKSKGDQSLRARLAKLLSRRADSLLLLTATPHDGSQESFASLIEMLDPTRIPAAKDLRRDDIEDLVIRRFRTSPEVIEAIGKIIPKRKLNPRHFPLSNAEELVYQQIAELQLDMDVEKPKTRGMDLFRTTLAKAIFSSPAACLETVERRLASMRAGMAGSSAADRGRLENLAENLGMIGKAEFSKYQNLLAMLKEMKWTGSEKRDRLVIFSERIRTVAWLEERLKADLELDDDMVGRIDGGSVEADENIQKVLEDFGQLNKPIRILIASDMASEGLNLHFQSHRLIHFDLPWSLLRFQQRNGRIDRYGQDRPPQIYYFVGDSAHPRVRDMWVLEKLVAKDEAAQLGVGDPAVFLGQGDADLEEEVVANAISSGAGADAFEAEMDRRAAEVKSRESFDDAFDSLFGDFSGACAKPTMSATAQDQPRLFQHTFAYASEMLRRLHERHDGLLADAPIIDQTEGMIQFALPEDMTSDGGLGYSRSGEVDEKYMPAEAIHGGKIRLTSKKNVIDTAIEQARSDERAWPGVQFLWDGHTILSWFSDRSEIFFPDRSTPLCIVPGGRLAKGEVCVVLHGAIPNEVGSPIVDLWGVVCLNDGQAPAIEDVPSFISRTRLNEKLPNTQARADTVALQSLMPVAVDAFQSHLVGVRRQREAEIERSLDETLARLGALQSRFVEQIELDLGATEPNTALGLDRRRALKKENRRRDVEEMFSDWSSWFQRNRTMVKDPNPYVEIKAVFAG